MPLHPHWQTCGRERSVFLHSMQLKQLLNSTGFFQTDKLDVRRRVVWHTALVDGKVEAQTDGLKPTLVLETCENDGGGIDSLTYHAAMPCNHEQTLVDSLSAVMPCAQESSCSLPLNEGPHFATLFDTYENDEDTAEASSVAGPRTGSPAQILATCKIDLELNFLTYHAAMSCHQEHLRSPQLPRSGSTTQFLQTCVTDEEAISPAGPRVGSPARLFQVCDELHGGLALGEYLGATLPDCLGQDVVTYVAAAPCENYDEVEACENDGGIFTTVLDSLTYHAAMPCNQEQTLVDSLTCSAVMPTARILKACENDEDAVTYVEAAPGCEIFAAAAVGDEEQQLCSREE